MKVRLTKYGHARECYRRLLCRCSFSLACAFVASATCHGQCIVDLGVLPGMTQSEAVSVSDDGSVVVGVCRNSSFDDAMAFRWVPSTGMQRLPMIGDEPSGAVAVSADGTTIVGYVGIGGDGFRLRMAGANTEFCLLGGGARGVIPVWPSGVSADGGTIVGAIGGGGFSIALPNIWTDCSSAVSFGDLPQESFGTAISADGSYATAYGCCAFDGSSTGQDGILWNSRTGSRHFVRPPGCNSLYPCAVSAYGEHVAGGAGFDGCSYAFRWSASSGLEILTSIEGALYSLAWDLTDNGSVIVGRSGTAEHQDAAIWVRSDSALLLRDLLSARGIDVSAWSELNSATAISGNGRFIVGRGLRGGNVRAFLVDLGEHPWPACWGDVNSDGTVGGADLAELLAHWGSAVPASGSDLNFDGRVDGLDLGILLANWGPCPN